MDRKGNMESDRFRIGSGTDVHELVRGAGLTIGGVQIPHEKGLKGHSDADVLLHSVCDALLGAAGLGDIGEHFPDTDQKYKGISSSILLADCVKLVGERGFAVVNLDVTLFAQAPKLSPYKKEMAENIAGILGVEKDRVNIKATTTESLGFVGRKEGIASQATLLLHRVF